MTDFKPPKAKDIQIRDTPKGYKVRCRHGWEKADQPWFALILWDAAWNKGKQEEVKDG